MSRWTNRETEISRYTKKRNIKNKERNSERN
jgi:hypothetical protein